MKVFRGLLVAAAALCAAAPAHADFLFTPGAGQTAFDFTCFASKHCFATVIVNSAGTEIMTTSNPGAVAGIGTAGAAAGGILTVQGVASMTALQAAQSGVWIVGQQGTWTVQQGTPPWSVSQSGTWNVGQTGAWTVNPTTAASWGIGSSTQNTAAVANGHLVLGEFNTSPTTITSGNMSPLQLDASANLLVNCKTGCTGGGGGATDQSTFTAGSSGFGPAGGVFNDTATLTTGQQGTFRLTTKRAQLIDIDSTGNQLHSDLTSPIPDCGATPCTNKMGNVYIQSQYPPTAVPYTSSATATTTGAVATLAGAASVTTYICGFSVRANATAATTVNIVVSGTISGSLNFTEWVAPLASGLGVAEQIFTPCIPASAANTSVVVTGGAPGAGGVTSTTAWGYKL